MVAEPAVPIFDCQIASRADASQINQSRLWVKTEMTKGEL
jgi:hypothetical protein